MEKRKDSNGKLLPENVTQRKDGTYMWRKSIYGVKYCIYAKTLGEIKQKRNIALGEIEKGEYKGKRERMEENRKQVEQDITLNEWFFQWEKTYRVGNVKESTLQNNHQHYMLHFSDTLGRMKLKNIKQIHIVNALNECHKEGNKYASLNLYNQILISLFQTAIQNGLLENNPAKGALQVPKEKRKERRILTEQEEERFFHYIRNHSNYKKYVPLFTVGFGTGMRIGEMLSLTWQDIDFDKNVIHVNKTLLYLYDYVNKTGKTKFIINSPKTETSIRDIPLLPTVKEAFLKQKAIQPNCEVKINGYTNFVFTTRKGNVMSDYSFRITLARIIRGLNQEEEKSARKEEREPVYFEPFSPHCMRHTFATRCYEKGVKEKVVQKILGHRKLDMTLNVYTHVTNDMILDDIRKLED